jgi:hypothetical protein
LRLVADVIHNFQLSCQPRRQWRFRSAF